MRRVSSTVALFLLLTGMFACAYKIQPVRADYGPIHINADGSIDPPTAPISTVDNVTYILTGNITSVGNGIMVYRNNIVIDGGGYTLMGTTIMSEGIELSDKTNVTIRNMQIVNHTSGIVLVSGCQHITIQGNNITTRGLVGIWLIYSTNNNIVGNTVTEYVPGQSYVGVGIQLKQSDNNSISENSLTGNNRGVDLSNCSYNTIRRNNISDNYHGIWIYGSSYNTISRNDITANSAGIFLYWALNNSVYGDNFSNNSQHVDDCIDSRNFLDNGYPFGGNYWSDYSGSDEFSGSYQNVTGSDSIGDTPYVIDANNTDWYPLMYIPTILPADLNHNHVVDIFDAIILANAYNSEPGSPNWNPNADINDDGIVDLFDAIMLASHYDEHYP